MHSGQHLSKKPGFYFRRTFDLCPPASIECRRYSPSDYYKRIWDYNSFP